MGIGNKMPTLTLVRGLPGSGKSTVARKLLGVHYEADQFFMKNGVYEFDATLLHKAHKQCQDNTRISLANGANVVVSNTFTTLKELKVYFDIAREFDIVPTVLACQNQFANVHGVPDDVLAKMKARWAHDISELFL